LDNAIRRRQFSDPWHTAAVQSSSDPHNNPVISNGGTGSDSVGTGRIHDTPVPISQAMANADRSNTRKRILFTILLFANAGGIFSADRRLPAWNE
jgi:hypothetical protein